MIRQMFVRKSRLQRSYRCPPRRPGRTEPAGSPARRPRESRRISRNLHDRPLSRATVLQRVGYAAPAAGMRDGGRGAYPTAVAAFDGGDAV
jgi:hypothetical protein